MNNNLNDFDAVINEKADKNDIAFQELAKRNEELNDRLLEQRFFFILLSIIVINMHAFPHMSGWGGPIAILFLELIVLLFVAEKCGVKMFIGIIHKILDGWAPKPHNSQN